MLESIKPLIDSGLVNEETKTQIQEAWEKKIAEAKETAKAELREEFARRYEHDKAVMVEALDKMVTESLKEELSEFAEDKKRLAEERVAFKRHVIAVGKDFQNFLVNRLAHEIKELREDKKAEGEKMKALEAFVIRQLSEEIIDFSKDKKDLAETKVKLLRSAKSKLGEVRSQLIKGSAKLIKEAVSKNLKAELTQFKEDIKAARENAFGRKLFEAFAAEFAATHLNENAEMKKLMKIIEDQGKVIKEATEKVVAKEKLVESKEAEIARIKDKTNRETTMSTLLESLAKDKASLMKELLENVPTQKLKLAFDKYLPAVLNGSKPSKTEREKIVIVERKEVTGDKNALQVAKSEDDINFVDIKRLAGLTK